MYVEGTIVTGKPEPSPFGSEPDDAYSTPLRKALDKLADDKDVKAVVLAGQLAGRLGRGQRDHSQRREAGEG